MKKIALLAIAAGASAAFAQPATYLDLGVIGSGGTYIFNTDDSVLVTGGNMDTELGLWDSVGTLLDADDDGSDTPGLWSEIEIELAEGVYWLAVSEFNSVFEDGWVNSGSALEDGESGTAIMNINGAFAGSLEFSDTSDQESAFFRVEVVPTPASASLLALGGMAAGRRRRSA